MINDKGMVITAQIKLLDAILKPAISKALWQDRDKTYYQLLNRSAHEYDNMSKEVEKVRSLTWLLAETDFALALATQIIKKFDATKRQFLCK